MYPVLSGGSSLRKIEFFCIYNRKTDELYELNEEGFYFLLNLDGTKSLKDLSYDKEFLDFLLKEGVIEISKKPTYRKPILRASPVPSLRYLEVQITGRCNLSCKHCYIEERLGDMDLSLFTKIVDEFEEMGGLRLMVSGGEPTIHRNFEKIADILSSERYTFRRVLLTNGIIYRGFIKKGFDEVQVSIDGLEKGNDMIRGKGSFRKAMDSILKYLDDGLDVSVATMLHRGNVSEIEEMGRMLRKIGIREWGIDVPCISGKLKENTSLLLEPHEAAPYISYSFGGSYHGESEGMVCGYHLLTIFPDGIASKCGFYRNRPIGDLKRESLAEVWRRKKDISIHETDCHGCEYLDECGGGCRFRAGDYGKDPYMCAYYGWLKKESIASKTPPAMDLDLSDMVKQ